MKRDIATAPHFVTSFITAMKVQLTVFLFSASLLPCLAQETSSTGHYKNLHPLPLEGTDDTVLTGTFAVFENRETHNGRMIDLNIVVIPALHPDEACVPVFYLEGGPGVSSANPFNIYFYADSANGYRLCHDIVLVDIRGTGKSNPLNCTSLQVKPSMQNQFDDMYPADAVADCYDELSKRADLTQYTTVNVVKDLEEVRKFLGYDRISLFGLSYGTRVGLVYMKMFPAPVHSCVLWSPEPTYVRMPLYFARFAQNSLDQLFDQCRRDTACHAAYPHLKDEFSTLMQRGRSAPFRVAATDSTPDLTISPDAFAATIRQSMYFPAGLRELPYLIHQCYLGNFAPFLSSFPNRADTNNLIAEGLYLCVTCAEDVPFIRNNETDAACSGTFMSTYRIDQQRRACRNWARGKIPGDYFEPVTVKIPTLIISGGMDPVTPTSQAQEIASHLPNSHLIIIPEMSHTFDGLDHPECFDRIVVDFIDHPVEPSNTDCISLMLPPPFRLK